MRMGFSRRESVLGLAVMALAVAFFLPLMKADLDAEQVQRARLQARAVAQTVVDFNLDTGRWPRSGDGQADLAKLLGAPAAEGPEVLVGSLVRPGAEAPRPAENPGPDEAPWLAEEPRDPWNRPFLVLLPEGESGVQAVLVVSAGPDGRLETGAQQWAQLSLGGRLAPGPLTSGDDIGYLLGAAAGPQTP